MTNDLSDTILAKSDQLDAIDLVHPQTFTITKVTKVVGEQPVNIAVAEFPRVWRPSTNMRRVLVALWGKDGDAYVGRRVTLYNDESVTFGKEKTGGIRISHLSHIDGPSDPAIMITRGKYGTHHVEPLTESQVKVETGSTAPVPEPTADQIAACSDPAELRTMWHASGVERRAQITVRAAELNEIDGPMIPEAS